MFSIDYILRIFNRDKHVSLVQPNSYPIVGEMDLYSLFHTRVGRWNHRMCKTGSTPDQPNDCGAHTKELRVLFLNGDGGIQVSLHGCSETELELAEEVWSFTEDNLIDLICPKRFEWWEFNPIFYQLSALRRLREEGWSVGPEGTKLTENKLYYTWGTIHKSWEVIVGQVPVFTPSTHLSS